MGNVVERGVHDGLPWLLHGADDARHQAVLAYLGVEGGHSGTCRDKNVDVVICVYVRFFSVLSR